MELTIRVICECLPGREFMEISGSAGIPRRDIHLGPQRGEDVIDAVPADRERAVFDLVFPVAERAGGATNFLGPFAKGTPGERFFYLAWLARSDGGALTMFRRAKIPLSHLPWATVKRAIAAGAPLTVHLSLTDRRGGPRSGSIPDGEAHWQFATGE